MKKNIGTIQVEVRFHLLSEAIMKLKQTRIIIIARFRKSVADDNLRKQFGSRSGRTFCRPVLDLNCLIL